MTSAAVLLVVSASVTSVIGFHWKTGEWGDCQIAKGACNTYTSIPVYGHRTRLLWCYDEQIGRPTDDQFCQAQRRPHSSSVCFSHCPRCAHHSRTSWSPFHCDACVGRQRRRLVCSDDHHHHNEGPPLLTTNTSQVASSINLDANRPKSGSVIEEERACFSPALCKGTSEAIRQTTAISQTSPLRPPEALTASFVPYLHVGAWSECQQPPAPQEEVDGGGQQPVAVLSTTTVVLEDKKKNKKHRRKKKRRRKKHSKRSSHFQPPELPPGLRRPPPWSPDLDDLEINYIANSIAAPEHGFQRREVDCRGQDGEVLPFRVCVDGQSQTVVPASLRTCVISENCVTGSWSEWALDENECDDNGGRWVKRMVRHRQIEKLPQSSGGAPCPHLKEYKPLLGVADVASNGSATCQPRYMLAASSWGPCRVIDQGGNQAICGGGLQNRNISCLRSQGRQPVDLQQCYRLPQLPRVQRCFVPCTHECRVGPWSDWSSCVPKDCSTSHKNSEAALVPQLPGKQTRHRRLVASTANSAAGCPHLSEQKDCSIGSCYSWRLEQQEECFLPREIGRSCGMGTRKLLFACMDFHGNPVPAEACAQLEKPPYEEECHKGCPEECVLSAWTEWSSCPSTCLNSRVNRRLPLSFRNRTLLALSSGQKQQDCHQLSEVRVCKRQTDCDVFHWRAGLWNACVVLNRTANCGAGFKKREAICVMSNQATEVIAREVPDWRCQGLELPMLEDTCFKHCPKNCQVTEWSAWTSCQDQCLSRRGATDLNPTVAAASTTTSTMSSSFTVIMNTQSRYRRVLQSPEHGGQNCPNLIDVRPCPLQSGNSCMNRFWKPQPWSNCILPENKSCGEGLRVRELDCISAGSKVDRLECLNDPSVLSTPVPEQHQDCSVDCVLRCEIGPWAPWSECSAGCPSKKTRSRSLSHQSNCSSISDTEEESCPCQNYRSVPSGDWSNCLIVADGGSRSGSISTTEGPSSIIASPFCGIGKRYRRLDCLDMSNQLAESIHCDRQRYETESCIISCPTDCLMSPWSEWGLCDAVCGYGLKNRTSKVLRLASVGGRPCPGPSVQYSTCNYECEHFQWVTSAWSECHVTETKTQSSTQTHQNCGRGEKRRTIRCVEKTTDGLEMDVPSHYCDPENRPVLKRDCVLHCPGECVISEWTEWSTCHSKDCVENGLQLRNRSFLRRASSNGKCSSSDPHLEETRPCDKACFFRYEWSFTGWSSCQPVGDSACGEGKRRRGVRCLRLGDDRPVRDDLCDGKNRPKEQELETWCPTDCPIDCEVSSWSPWDTSQCQCGAHRYNMTRTRVQTTDASPTGRPCPPVRTESRPCPSRPCYELIQSAISCDLQGAACGVGLARYNVSCVRQGTRGPTEPISKCRKALKLVPKEDICFKSCPTDCVLSDWSPWSNCRGQCLSAKSIGVRTRSRNLLREAVRPHGQCLSDLKQSEACVLQACFTFSSSSIVASEAPSGSVKCIRSDGLIVEDHHCQGHHHPPHQYGDQHGCDPPCRVLHSECGSDLKCRCLRGYHPTYLPAPILSSRPPTLVYCQILSEVGSNAAMADGTGSLVEGLGAELLNNTGIHPISPWDIHGEIYDDDKLNPWMLAMIGIGGVFIAFVGVSIYLMCKTTNQEMARSCTTMGT